MPLDRLKAEQYNRMEAWKDHIGKEIAKRESSFQEQHGRPPTQEEGQNMIDEIVREQPYGIKDLFYIQGEIGRIYAERLDEEVTAILAKRGKEKKLRGIIDLFGLTIATEDDAAYSNIFYKELGEVLPAFILPEQFTKEKRGLLNNRHNPNDSPAAAGFIMDNWDAIIAELRKREREQRKEVYGYVRGGKTTTALALAYRAKKPEDKDVNIGEITVGDVRIVIGEGGTDGQETLPGFEKLQKKMTASLQHTTLYMLKCLHEGGARAGRISGRVAEYAKVRGITDREAHDQLRAGMAILRALKVSFSDKRTGDFDNTYLFGGREYIKNGVFSLSCSKDFLDMYFKQPVLPIALRLFEINLLHNPYSLMMAWKMLQHFNMNKADPNANRISVRSLIEVCVLCGMKTYEEVRTGSARGVTRAIIGPFERDLNLLEDMGIITWQYADRGRDEVDDIPFSYSSFIDKIILFWLIDYPDPAQQIALIKKGREDRQKAKRRGELKRLEKQSEGK